MHPSQRIVTRMPLANLWDDEGQLNAHRVRHVGRKEIAQLLRDGLKTFVVADVGLPLRWIPEQDRFTFWKAEVRDRLVPVEAHSFYLEDYSNEFCYIASEWRRSDSEPIVVLEKCH